MMRLKFSEQGCCSAPKIIPNQARVSRCVGGIHLLSSCRGSELISTARQSALARRRFRSDPIRSVPIRSDPRSGRIVATYKLTPVISSPARTRPRERAATAMSHGQERPKLLSPKEIAGTWHGNGCFCSPECMRIDISPACCGCICVLQYCEGCPIPVVCQFMVPCFGMCYTDCDNEGYWTPDANTIDGKCGYGFKRDGSGGGAPPASLDMVR